MINLFVEGVKKTKGVYNMPTAVVPVSWTIPKKVDSINKKYDLENPHILIIISSVKEDGTTVFLGRKTVPLTQLKTYVSVHRGGDMSLHGYLIDGDEDDIEEFSAYEYNFYGSYRNKWLTTKSVPHIEDGCRIWSCNVIDVNIPHDQFAQEWPEWLMFYVNLWHSDKLRDQCHRKGRLGILLAFKIWAIIFYALIFYPVFSLFSGSVALLAGYRDIRWKDTLHPFGDYFITEHCNNRNNILYQAWQKYVVGHNSDVSGAYIVFSPLCILLTSFVLAITVYGTLIVDLPSFIIALSMSGVVVVKILASFLLIVLAIKAIIVLLGYVMGSAKGKITQRRQLREMSENYEPIVYSTYKPKFSFKLFYEELKAKVCKPLPR